MRYYLGLTRRFLYAICLLVMFMGATAGGVAAAMLPSGAFIISPVKQELTIAPGGEKTVTLTLTNGTPYPLTVSASYEDIAPQPQHAAGDDPVKLVGESGRTDSLRSLIDFPKQSFDLLSGKEIQVPVTVALPKDTTPGGRYGSVIWAFKVAHKTGEVAPANVALESRIASLFFVRVEGEVSEAGQLVSFGLFNDAQTTAQPGSNTPMRLEVSYENKGNVHLDPYGRVTISGMFNDPKVLIIDPWVVLPGATRMREVDLFAPLIPGYYHAHIELNRGYNNIVDERDVAFWVLPSALEWFIGLVILILLILLIRRSLALSKHSVS